MINIKGHYTTAKVMIDTVEETCVEQIKGFVNHEAFTKPVAIMPDTHAGKGSVIGFTMELTDKVIPNVIGVDIGCGMLSTNLGKEVELDFAELDKAIRKGVPFGKEVHNRDAFHMKNDFPWERVNKLARDFADAYKEKFGLELTPPTYDFEWFEAKTKQIGGSLNRYISSVGTLGGGNHFIETGRGEKGDIWITIHSGSRNFGLRICDYWQDVAGFRHEQGGKGAMQERIKKFKEEFTGSKRELKAEIKKIMREYKRDSANGLDWLEGDDAAGYLFDMLFAQVYASVNREEMAKAILAILGVDAPVQQIETVHNYIDFTDFVIRKGAIRSYEGEQMIIPFNMRDGILLCEGKSNSEWNCSAPHGAGRVMSRSQARKKISLDKFKSDMEGIYSTSVNNSTIDEAPDSYKDARIIEEAIGDTAVIIDRIKPLHNMKDSY